MSGPTETPELPDHLESVGGGHGALSNADAVLAQLAESCDGTGSYLRRRAVIRAYRATRAAKADTTGPDIGQQVREHQSGKAVTHTGRAGREYAVTDHANA